MMEVAVYRRPTNYLKETTMLSKNRKSKRKCLLLDYSSGTKTTEAVQYVEAGCSVCIMYVSKSYR